jgi:hypothetical protein
MSTANLSSATILTNIITAPQLAFAAIKERPVISIPLVILIALSCAASIAYILSVDLPWMLDQTFAQANNLPPAERERALQVALKVPRAVYALFGAAGGAIGLPIVLALTALYYMAVSFFTHDNHFKFQHWFSLAAWCAIPLAFGLVASLVHVLAGDARFMRPEELNPFSFASLFGIDMAGATTLQRVLLGRDVTAVWSVVLSIVGYQAFTKRSLAFSGLVVLGPLALIVAIGTLLALR